SRPVVATITAAAPSVGASAPAPGQAVSELNVRAASRIATAPDQPSIVAIAGAIRGHRFAPIATDAPMPSSHRRVVVMKNAPSGFEPVYATDHTKDGTMTARMVAASAERSGSRRVFRTRRATATTSSGHTM